MSTNRKAKAPAQPDPSETANRKVLADRATRIASQPKPTKAVRKESTATDPVVFLTEEFDKQTFGEGLPTIQRVVYGPDSLLDDAAFKERIEQFGVDEIAECSKRAILDKGALAFPNVRMQAVTAAAIQRFGVEKVAQAFFDRVMQIPVRTVEVEVDREDEMLGNPLKEAVNRYSTPGFAVKFMSESCIAQLGMRGYRIVRDHGDPVKIGTLIMAEIPIAIAERRLREYAEESKANVREAEENYQEAVDRTLSATPGSGGARALERGEIAHANASDVEERLGEARAAGISFEDGFSQ